MLALPGGLTLPIGLEITEYIGYDVEPGEVSSSQAEAQMRAQAGLGTQQAMIAGQILEVKGSLVRQDGIYEYTASIRCSEMIARMVRASILQPEVKEETIP